MILHRQYTTLSHTCWMVALLLGALYSCNSATDTQQNPTDSATRTVDISQMIPLADTTFSGQKISLWATDSLENKFETLYLKLEDEKGNPLPDVSVDYNLTMDMGMMNHGGPYYPLVSKGGGIYQADVVFIMANMKDMGKGWLFKTLLKGQGKVDTLTFMLPVRQASIPRTLATGTSEDTRVFVSCLLPSTIEVGVHPIEFVLHKMSQETFPTLDGYSVEVDPIMPQMGHGSSGNKNAEGKGNGHYTGIVNLSMPGEWQVKVKLLKDGKPISQDSLVYPIYVKEK